MTQEPVIEVRDVVVDYPGHPPVRAVDGVSFDLRPGEVVGMVGESGCGKSTMARVISGLLKPTSGEVRYRGERLPPLGVGARPPQLTGIQMVFQDPGSSLNPRRRVGDQIRDGIQAAREREAWERKAGAKAGERGASGQGEGAAAEASPAWWLEHVGLPPGSDRRFPRSFSGGQRQRIAAARALAARPSVLVGDEPISSLDASTQAHVAWMLCQLAAEQNAALLFISHDLSVVRLIADRLVVMYAGRIVERGPTDEVWNEPRHPYTEALLGAIPAPDGAGRLPVAAPASATFSREEAVR